MGGFRVLACRLSRTSSSSLAWILLAHLFKHICTCATKQDMGPIHCNGITHNFLFYPQVSAALLEQADITDISFDARRSAKCGHYMTTTPMMRASCPSTRVTLSRYVEYFLWLFTVSVTVCVCKDRRLTR